LPRGQDCPLLPAEGRKRPITGALVKATATGAMLGTPLYMSPEQIMGEPLDARTDQFAFAVAAWEAVCGGRPYDGTTVEDLRDAIVSGHQIAPKRRVPARIRRVLSRGMAADAAARWPSVRALIKALRSAERRPRVVAAIAGAAVAAGAVATWALWPAPDPEAVCDDAGAEVETIVPGQIVDEAAAAARRGGTSGDAEAALLIRSARELRTGYRAFARNACLAETRGHWSPQIAQASRDCIAFRAHTFREILAIAPQRATQPSDIVQIIGHAETFGACSDHTRLGVAPLM
jgi:hypothetical protein